MAIDDIRIETQRLILRPPNGDDFEAWAAFQTDEATMAYIGGVKSRAESWRVLCAMGGAWRVRGYAMFSLILKDSGQWIGRIGPWYPEGWPGTEVGWAVAPEYAGKGYALEAMTAAQDWLDEKFTPAKTVCIISPENAPSIALAEKLGFRATGEALYNENTVRLFERLKPE